jgi:DNA-binding transcriptional LysR family regulator
MKLEDVEVFVEAVKAGSLAGAARRLSVSAMAASRSLNNLEAELGSGWCTAPRVPSHPPAMGPFLPHAQALLEDKNNALADLFPEGRTFPDDCALPPQRGLAVRSLLPC